MFPLVCPSFPTSHAALSSALSEGLSQSKILAREVRVRGGDFPAIDELHLDLTGTQLSRNSPLPLPHELEPSGTGTSERLFVQALEVFAAPLSLEGAPIQLQLKAEQAILVPATSRSGACWLTVASALRGTLDVRVQHSDLETLAHSLVSAAAAKQGVEIKKTRLTLSTETPRKVRFQAEVTAKMFIMSAAVSVTGTAEIDSELNLRLQELACHGDGMIASAANALLKPHFAKLEGNRISLRSIAPAGVELRDVRLETAPDLHLSAVFSA